MITLSDILRGGILPGIVALIVLVSVWKLTKSAASSWRTAVVVSFLAGLWALDAQGVGISTAISKSVRITEAKDLLPLMVILAGVPDAVATLGARAAQGAWLLRVALCGFLPWQMLSGTKYLPKFAPPPNFDSAAWTTLEMIGWLGGTAVALLATWALVRGENTELPRLRSILVAVVALAASATIALSGSFTYGQAMGVLVAALTGCALASWLMRTGRGPDAAAGAIVIAFGGVLVLALFIAELKLLYAILLILAFAVAGGWFFPGKKWSTPVRCTVCLLAIGVTVGLAAMDFAAAQAEAANNPYMNL